MESTGGESEFVRRAEALALLQSELRRLLAHERKRRIKRLWLGFVGFVLAVYTAISLHDQHVQHCMVFGKPATLAEARICNLTILGHDHKPFDGLTPEVIAELRERLGLTGGAT